MTNLAIHHNVQPMALARPEPRSPIAIRVAAATDIKFIDSLQKLHTKMVGWMPTKQLETYVQRGHVLVAEDGAQPLGYCISRDQYFKRDDVGIIYQLNVTPTKQRGLIGAALIKAVFERAAYGCKLFCCWCAQDIAANHFWESLGFIPLAFRAGSRNKQRIHIFWQRRVREGDVETPYWFPSQTTGGAIREDRLVIPIPPGTHWSDAKPMVLPGGPGQEQNDAAKALPGEGDAPKQRKPRPRGPKPKVVVRNPHAISLGGLRFGPPPTAVEPKPPKPKREKRKNDPKYVAAARELRDRYLEQINAGTLQLESAGKYDVSRQLEAAPTQLKRTQLLNAA